MLHQPRGLSQHDSSSARHLARAAPDVKSSPLLHCVFPVMLLPAKISHCKSRRMPSLYNISWLWCEHCWMLRRCHKLHMQSLHERNSERGPGFAMYLAVWQSPPVPSFSTKINICGSRECPTCPGSLTSRRQSNQMLRQRGDVPSPSLHEDPHPCSIWLGFEKRQLRRWSDLIHRDISTTRWQPLASRSTPSCRTLGTMFYVQKKKGRNIM